ncbi:MAG: hypothetical protein JOY83_08360 [Alphaproteobacteria bacterium]|nr:hypothetical protein [Alphaproteobacteria bacterium]
MKTSVPLRASMRAYADLLRRWAGGDDDRVIELAAPRSFSTLRDTALECARAADEVAGYLALPIAERRRRAPLRSVLRHFAEAHHHFGTALRLAVRIAVRSDE